MIQRIATHPYLVFIVLVYDIYNIIRSLTGVSMEYMTTDWFNFGIKVFLCVLIFMLLKYVKELQEMLSVHKAVSYGQP